MHDWLNIELQNKKQTRNEKLHNVARGKYRHIVIKGAAITWLKYCRYDVKLYPFNQSTVIKRTLCPPTRLFEHAALDFVGLILSMTPSKQHPRTTHLL